MIAHQTIRRDYPSYRASSFANSPRDRQAKRAA